MTNRSMTVYEKMLVSFTAVLALSFGTAPSVHAMHIMEGYLPGGSCIAWGRYLSSVSFSRLSLYSPNTCVQPESAGSSCHVRSIHFRYFFFEDPFRNRKLFPHDRYRTGSHFIRSFRCKHSGSHCAFVPGNSPGSRRSDYSWCKHLLHGCCRPHFILAHLYDLQKAQNKPACQHLSCRCPG